MWSEKLNNRKSDGGMTGDVCYRSCTIDRSLFVSSIADFFEAINFSQFMGSGYGVIVIIYEKKFLFIKLLQFSSIIAASCRCTTSTVCDTVKKVVCMHIVRCVFNILVWAWATPHTFSPFFGPK